MNKLLVSLCAWAALVGLGASSLSAQSTPPPPRIVVVAMAKLLDDHYETAEQNEKLRGEEARANEELEKLNKEGQVLIELLRELEERVKNPTLSPEAKARLEADQRGKIEEIQRKQQEVQSFRANTQRSLQQRIQNFRQVLFAKISDTVTEVAKKRGATLVLDKSGLTHIGLSVVVYSDPAYDITEEVQREIDRFRPASATTSSAPATTTTPTGRSGTTPTTPAAPGSTTTPATPRR